MKKGILILCVIALAAASCKKEGPQGPAGPQGVAGKDGTNGKDATVKCTQCHDKNSKILAAQFQYEKSGHLEDWVNEPASGCAMCHTNEGFNECIANGTLSTAKDVVTPTPQGCYTCHNIHTNYDSTDLSLKTTAPVKMRYDNSTIVDAGKGNLCVNCHQPRVVSVPSTIDKPLTATSTDSIQVKSNRFGPHHGAQGTMLLGKGAYEVAGTIAYTNSPHTSIANTCVSCHMANPVSGIAGGHTWWVVYTDPDTQAQSVNVNGCGTCHPGVNAAAMLTKIQNTQTEINGLLGQLKDILVAKNFLDGTTDLFKATSSKPLKLSANQARVCYNYKFVEEDKTNGVHNANYARAILKNSIALAGTW